MAIGIDLTPSAKYLEHNKSGKLNMSGTIKNVVKDLPDGTTFRDHDMFLFIKSCGSSLEDLTTTHHFHSFSSGKIGSSLNNIATRHEYLSKPMTNYFEVHREDNVEPFSVPVGGEASPGPKTSTAREKLRKGLNDMTLDELNEMLFS